MLTRHVAGRVYNYEFSIGRVTAGGNGFSCCRDFALGSGGSVYILSKGTEFVPSHGITKCTLDHQLLWDARGPAYCDGQSPWPSSVDLDSEENVYVSDDYVNRVFVYDKDGGLLTSWGTPGSREGELDGPSGLAFDKEDDLYVVDSRNHRVQKFTREGKFLGSWGGPGDEPGQLNMPWGIAVDKARGDIYVADWKNDRVQKFTPDGRYLATFGSPGSGDGQLRRPTGVAVDDQGDVYVTDWGNERLNIYNTDGAFLTAFLGDAHTLSRWGQDLVDANPDYQKARRRVDLAPEQRLQRPVAVNVADDGRFMVLETERARMQVYIKERNFVDAQFNL